MAARPAPDTCKKCQEHRHKPSQYGHVGLFIVGTGSKRHSGVYTIIEPGRFLVLGTETKRALSVR